MDSPYDPRRKGQTPSQMRQDFERRQRGQIVRLSIGHRLHRVRGLGIGALLGVAAVVVQCLLEHQQVHWHSYLWEAGLCGTAGYLLACVRGGTLNGLVLFAGAYAIALFLRKAGYDAASVLEPYAVKRVVSMHADFAALGALGALGALFGFATDRR